MKVFKESQCEMAYLKMGIYGKAGSGKTYTSSLIAIGLYKLIKSKKPVAFLDTETGSDFVKPLFEKAKIKLIVAKSRAFSDLLAATKEAEKESDIFIIDSITHPWNELLTSYQKKMEISRITLKHWIPIKQTWREFSELYIYSKLHVIMAGRAGDIWEDVEDEDGTSELRVTGQRMKAEVETGFEPSLLVEMVRSYAGKKKGWTHRAFIVKDRWDVLDGKFFDEPKFESFLPHIERLNIGGEHRAIDKERSSEDMFQKNTAGFQKVKEREILIEKIQNEIFLLYPGQTSEAKATRLELLKSQFKTHSWNEVCDLSIDKLSIGLSTIEKLNKKKEKKNA